jgi:hypothetical protein
VVVHTTRPDRVPFAHHRLLIETLHQYSADWEEIAMYPAGPRVSEEIRIYRSRSALHQQPRRVTVDLTNKINKILSGRF